MGINGLLMDPAVEPQDDCFNAIFYRAGKYKTFLRGVKIAWLSPKAIFLYYQNFTGEVNCDEI